MSVGGSAPVSLIYTPGWRELYLISMKLGSAWMHSHCALKLTKIIRLSAQVFYERIYIDNKVQLS